MAAETSPGARLATPLRERYDRSDLAAFNEAEVRRFVGRDGDDPRSNPSLAWELLYRLEPRLYDRLSKAERIHPAILHWLPARLGRVVEVGAGTGRLTVELVTRCEHLIAVEPALTLRALLAERLGAVGASADVHIVNGVFEALPLPDASADMVVACSALTPEPAHGGDAGLAEMERVCAPGGRLVIIWPNHLDWLRLRGFRYESFPGPMSMEFNSAEEAAELAEVFYPHAVAEIRRRNLRCVPYPLLHVNPPRGVAYKDVSK